MLPKGRFHIPSSSQLWVATRALMTAPTSGKSLEGWCQAWFFGTGCARAGGREDVKPGGDRRQHLDQLKMSKELQLLC